VLLLGASLLGAALLARTASAGELFRCGSWVVSAEMSVVELKQKCGEPTRRTRETQDVYAHAAGGGTIRTGTATVERWIYERSGSLTMIVTITNGEITGMETAR
jgi:hypothetical protein